MSKPLTMKQAKFVEKVIACEGNATQAYKESYDVSTDQAARAGGYENLTKPHIASAVEEARQEIMDEVRFDAEELVRRFQRNDEAAYQIGQFQASNSALEGIRKTLGLGSETLKMTQGLDPENLRNLTAKEIETLTALLTKAQGSNDGR